VFVDADAATLARQTLAMEPTDYADAFRGSAVKRAEWCMSQRNAAAVSENRGTT